MSGTVSLAGLLAAWELVADQFGTRLHLNRLKNEPYWEGSASRSNLAIEGLERRDAPAIVVGELPTTASPSTGIEPPFGKWHNDDMVLFDGGSDGNITPPFGRRYNDQVVLYDGNGGNAPTTNGEAVGDTPNSTSGTSSPWDQAATDALMAQYATGVGTTAPPIDVTGEGAVNLSDFAVMKSGM